MLLMISRAATNQFRLWIDEVDPLHASGILDENVRVFLSDKLRRRFLCLLEDPFLEFIKIRAFSMALRKDTEFLIVRFLLAISRGLLGGALGDLEMTASTHKSLRGR